MSPSPKHTHTHTHTPKTPMPPWPPMPPSQTPQPSQPSQTPRAPMASMPFKAPIPAYTIQSQQPSIPQLAPMSTVKLMPNEQKYNTKSKMTPEFDNIYIDIQDYLRVMNFLFDKTKDNFISLDTVLTNLKPFLYKKK